MIWINNSKKEFNRTSSYPTWKYMNTVLIHINALNRMEINLLSLWDQILLFSWYIYIYIYIYIYMCVCVCVCVCVCSHLQIICEVTFVVITWNCPVGWGCRIHRLLLCRGIRHPPSTSVLDMTLNNLMVRFQQCWSFGECGVPLHCHRSQVHFGPRVVAPDKGSIYGLNRTKPYFFHYTVFLHLKCVFTRNWIV